MMPPLCSTTFGGATIPPLLGGGVIAPLNLRGVGAATILPRNDGHADTPVAKPVRVAGDMLFTYANAVPGAGMLPIASEVANWTAASPANLIDGGITYFFRVATNDSDDDFTCRSTSTNANFYTQMASFANTSAGILTIDQTGTLNNDGPVSDWELKALGTSVTVLTLVIAWYYFTIINSNVSPLTVVDNTGGEGFQTIGTGSTSGGGAAQTSWFGWSWRVDTATGLAAALVEQGYTPDPTSAFNFTRYIRYVQP